MVDFWSGFWTISLVHLLGAMSPGPDFLMVTRQSLRRGRRAGLLTSLGIAVGLSVHLAYSIAGLATLLAHSPNILELVKCFGGLYLIWLGIGGLRTRSFSGGSEAEVLPEASAWRLLWQGFLCNVLNPKAPVYFLALFTLVLSDSMPLGVLLVYGSWIMALQFLWFAAVTLLFTQPGLQARVLLHGVLIDRFFGVLMLLLGGRLLLSIWLQ